MFTSRYLCSVYRLQDDGIIEKRHCLCGQVLYSYSIGFVYILAGLLGVGGLRPAVAFCSEVNTFRGLTGLSVYCEWKYSFRIREVLNTSLCFTLLFSSTLSKRTVTPSCSPSRVTLGSLLCWP